ncbi:Uncharacterised protein [Pseudomonas aeruginosa]|nr:Uncharacterised protein [Pseudomonas aeruginosa]
MNLQNRNNLILSLIAETQFDAYVPGLHGQSRRCRRCFRQSTGRG